MKISTKSNIETTKKLYARYVSSSHAKHSEEKCVDAERYKLSDHHRQHRYDTKQYHNFLQISCFSLLYSLFFIETSINVTKEFFHKRVEIGRIDWYNSMLKVAS